MATENECVICFENIGEKNNCVTECGHKFCLKCLVTSIAHKNACPCCRTQLIDEIEGDDEEDEDFVPMENDDESDNDEEDEAHVEDVAERLEKQGITFIDVVSMLLNRYSKNDEKYTDAFINQLNEKFDVITAEVDLEYIERQRFAAEDRKATTPTIVPDALPFGVTLRWTSN